MQHRVSDNDVLYLGRFEWRHRQDLFGIRRTDRRSHIHLIGKTGTGKTTALESMIRQDIANGEGITVIDPHGDMVSRVAESIPDHRREDVIYFNVPDHDQPYGYNPLKRVEPKYRPLAASGMLEVFRKMWDDRAWGPRMEHILRNALLALLDHEEATLPDVLKLMTNKRYRRIVARGAENEPVCAFWLKEYEDYSWRFRADAIAPIQSKVGAFIADPNLRRILTAPRQGLNLRQIMDERKILLVNISRGQVGDDTASLLGGLLVTTLGLAAFSRANIPEEDRPDHWLYVDEFQNYTTKTMATMLSELRKYRIGMTLAHQYLHQLDLDTLHAVLGNAGTLMAFRVGAKDAAFLANEFQPTFTEYDLIRVSNYRVYCKLMIGGMPSVPFSMKTTEPPRPDSRV